MHRDESTKFQDKKYKIVFLGASGVGKSSIIDRFINNRYDDTRSETIGIDFLTKTISHQGKAYRLQLWDTAGQEKFKSLIPSYIKDAHCAVFVYDVTRPESFQSIAGWIKYFQQYQTQNQVTVIVGNKIDLLQVKNNQQAEEFLKKYENNSFQTQFLVSAKTTQNVEELFHEIVSKIKVKQNTENNQTNVLEDTPENLIKRSKMKLNRKKSLVQQNQCCSI